MISLLNTHSPAENIRHLRIQSALVFIPFFCCSNYLKPLIFKKLMKIYIGILSAALMYCFIIALRKYFLFNSDDTIWFYHKLVSPFNQNAVLVSVLFFIGLIHLMELTGKSFYFGNKYFHFLLIFYFIFCILMLSSKLVILFSLCYFIYYFIIKLKNSHLSIIILISIIFCIVIITVLITSNPINKRFNEIKSGNIALVQQQKFSPAIYFNGLQFRLLQWRFVTQILTENNAWLIGISSGDAQHYLDQKYISTNMYVGEPGSSNRGFLGYDTHNQFLESVLQTGIFGLFAFIFVCYGMVNLAIKRKSVELAAAVILLLLYSITESCFESQYGVLVFTFFPLFLYYGTYSDNNRWS